MVCASQTIIYIFELTTHTILFKISIQDLDQEYTKDYFISKIQFITNDQILIGTTNGNIILLNMIDNS